MLLANVKGTGGLVRELVTYSVAHRDYMSNDKYICRIPYNLLTGWGKAFYFINKNVFYILESIKNCYMKWI